MSINPVPTGQPVQVPRAISASGSPTGSQSAGSTRSTSNIQTAIANAQRTIANEVTTTNDNGTVTVTTTFTDGTIAAVTNPNPPKPAVSQKPIAPNNGQLAVLLQAQQQTSQG